MSKVSVLLAARGETRLGRMVDHLFTRLAGDFEIIVIQDGPPYQNIPERQRLTVVNAPYQGLYPSLNQAAALATGKYLLKFDAHCSVSEGIDVAMADAMQPNWILLPRFFTMDEAVWGPDLSKPYCDHWKIPCPLTDPKGYRFQASGYWFERTEARKAIGPLDESMFMHGSGWMVERDFFINKLGGADSVGYGVSYMEPAQFALKTWLGPWDGRVMVLKTASYSHLHQQASARGYGISMREIKRSYLWTAEHWMRNEDRQQVKPLGWLIDRFAPVPTWPENWRELQARYDALHPRVTA
jgi:glycosyltransferase involved in cell wall biosynthesis